MFTAGTLNNIPELETRFGARIEESSTFDYTIAEGRKLRVFSQNTEVNIPVIIKGGYSAWQADYMLPFP